MPDPVIRELMDRQDRVDEQDEGGGRSRFLGVGKQSRPGPVTTRRVEVDPEDVAYLTLSTSSYEPNQSTGLAINSRQVSALAGLRSAMPNDADARLTVGPEGLLVLLPDGRLYAIDVKGKTERLTS